MERYSGRNYLDTTTRRFIFMKRGKKYQDAVKSFDKANQYDVAEANQLSKKERYSEV